MRRLNVQLNPELSLITRPRAALTWTRHAQERVRTKRVEFSESVQIEKGQVVELELTHQRVSKLVIRQAQCPDWDRVLVLVPNGEGWTVVTCWLNRKTDTHKTLNRSRISA